MKTRHLQEFKQKTRRLGRHVQHDPRSKGFPVKVDFSIPYHDASWRRRCPPFDQGDLGSCTGNAICGASMTDPVWKLGRNLTEVDAVDIYKHATKIDGIPGVYPPTDTGSTGLAVCKAALKAGLIDGYNHAFGLDHALRALMLGPIIIGIHWYDSFDTPAGNNAVVEITPGAQVRGGHEIEAIAIRVAEQDIILCNSWGDGWGNHGCFSVSWKTFDRLLSEDGDVKQVH